MTAWDDEQQLITDKHWRDVARRQAGAPTSPAAPRWRLRKVGPNFERHSDLSDELMEYVYRQNYLDWQAGIKADPENRWRAWMAAPSVPGVEDGPARLPKCTRGLKLMSKACGHNQAIVIGCGNPDCANCERRRAGKAIDRWSPALARMKNPKQVVLAIRSGHDAIATTDLFVKCLNRFFDLRLGSVARKRYRQACIDFIELHRAEFDANHKADQKRFSADKWLRSCERFWLVQVPELERRRRAMMADKSKAAQALKVRHILYGLRALELTYNIFSSWHPHAHCGVDLVDGGFLPFPALAVLWQQACTVNGESFASFADPDEQLEPGQVLGRTAHISAVRDVRELLKYVTKHQAYDDPAAAAAVALPSEKISELRECLHARKRVWPIGPRGMVRPAPALRPPCPGCQDTECKCHPGGEVLRVYLGGDMWRSQDGERCFQIERLAEGGLVWRGLPSPLLDTTGNLPTEQLALGAGIGARAGPGP